MMKDEQVDGMMLNFLPVTLSSNEVSGFKLPYSGKEQLRNLQDRYRNEFLLKRAGKQINAVSLSANAKISEGEACTFSSSNDWGLFSRLIEEGVRRYLRQNYPNLRVREYGAILIETEGEKNDIVREALKKELSALGKIGFIHIYRKYRLGGSYVRRTLQDEPQHGLLIKISTSWHINASIAELISKGVDVKGCYIVPLKEALKDHEYGYQTVGCVSSTNGDQIRLVDFRNQEIVDAREYTIEASLDNVTRCINALLGASQGRKAMALIRAEVGKLLNAEGQLQRIDQIATAMSKAPIFCADDLTATVSEQVLSVNSQSLCKTLALDPPKFMLFYGRNPISWPVTTALSSQGPLDRDNFKKTTPHILVITPKQYQGRVEQFLRTWRDGGLKAPYNKGFVEQYKLRGCDFHVISFNITTAGLAEDYRQACRQALQESREMVRRYDLAFVVVEEHHRLLGYNDPYLISKAALMNDGIPVQVIEFETIALPVENQRFILNNLSLACYAKLGGTPWLLAASKGGGITHELVIGLGNSVVADGRLGEKERYVGITTLFNYDGMYLVSNVSQESAYEDYSDALHAVLQSSVNYVSIQQGWQRNDQVRLIFHTSKPLKNLEIETVKRFMRENLPQYQADFAFLKIGQDHRWTIYDPKSKGFTNLKGQVRGEQVPKRGTTIILDNQRALLSMTGPEELKLPEQGCPAPVQLSLNGASEFQDLEYLSEQVFNFSYMSWRTFNLLSKPITIEYGEAIANLLGRLRRVKNWNSEVLQTTELKSSLWFL
ncbi:MAG: hypothetical protein HS114_00755 [Anaerolineales bacterium]|nr:hypothetical protein [Anaerolineales bacterium]